MGALKKERLNRSLSPKIVDARVAYIFNTFDNVLLTSSFGTTSAILLHIVSRVRPDHPIYFIDTHYHFDETIDYKERLTRRLDLNVIDLTPDAERHAFTREDQTWNRDPDYCCQINKVEPLNRVKEDHDAWISGLIGYESNYRKYFEIFEEAGDIFKFYPLVDWSDKQVEEYFELYGLPRHPLENKGYESIGCTHCTVKGDGRGGRWPGCEKTECGLHKSRSDGS